MFISIPCALRLLMAALNYAGLSIVGWVAAWPWVGRLWAMLRLYPGKLCKGHRLGCWTSLVGSSLPWSNEVEVDGAQVSLSASVSCPDFFFRFSSWFQAVLGSYRLYHSLEMACLKSLSSGKPRPVGGLSILRQVQALLTLDFNTISHQGISSCRTVGTLAANFHSCPANRLESVWQLCMHGLFRDSQKRIDHFKLLNSRNFMIQMYCSRLPWQDSYCHPSFIWWWLACHRSRWNVYWSAHQPLGHWPVGKRQQTDESAMQQKYIGYILYI